MCSNGSVPGERAQVRRRLTPPWWDAAVAAGFLAFGSLLFAVDAAALDPSRGEQVPVLVRIAVLTLGCAAQVLRARRPGTALGAGVVGADVALGFSIPLLLVFVDLLYCAAPHGSRRTSRTVVAAALVLTAVAAVVAAVLTRDLGLTLLVVLQGAGLLLVPVFWGSEVRQHWDAAATERANAAQAARIAELDRQAAVGAERARMARDLHDVVAGHLSAIAIQSEAVMSMADTDPATARTVLRSVRENSVRSLEEMQTMIGLLRADGAADPPTAPARLADLDPLLDSARAGGLHVTADLPDPVPALPVAVGLAAYRIVQEALTNAKHAAGSRTCVAVHRRDAELVVEVVNELTAPVTDGEGTGLVSMRERAHATGGTLSAGRCGSGWRVRAVLPTGGAGT